MYDRSCKIEQCQILRGYEITFTMVCTYKKWILKQLRDLAMTKQEVNTFSMTIHVQVQSF